MQQDYSNGIINNNNKKEINLDNSRGLINKKSELTVDFIMIIGKYFESNKDFINIMKVCKKYKELVSMYFFNPISDTTLFENLQTQHFYKKQDINKKLINKYQYIYWYYEYYNNIKNKNNNDIYKNVIFNNRKINKIPNYITKLDDSIYYDCKNLTDIELPNTLKDLGCHTFSNSSLIEINIPEGITKIDNECFCRCNLLTNIKLPNTLKKIDNYAFYNTKIKSIIIPNNVTKLGDNCFSECYELENVFLSTSLKEIGEYAFYYSSIKNINIPNEVTEIKDGCFKKCIQLKNINLPINLKILGKSVFKYTSLKIILLPNLNIIGKHCLYHCYKSIKLILPIKFKNEIINIINEKNIKEIIYY